ncbi:lipopolysaccharide biosynthesis protein [Sporosarcina sp. HYO08]|uniref:lipopolysaccharide biosynthesis protein n=1 Tax=Sporosarcina sp. HYO08 TaxID=1759557 RepID=UPI00079C9063|nr:oligosaccharide flippase family protein [Sporosarcina sp. HYO08]KXH86085.1 polysaccharide biosynthesis protein [Sporosarcina sp. HYO08]
MKSKLKKILKKPFVRNVIIMATGTAAAQGISLLLLPLITRLYGPEAYGLMGVFMAVVMIVTPIAALTYPIAIVLPKQDEIAKALIRLSLYITLGISGITLFILLLFKQPIVQLFQIEDIAPYLFLIPIVILFAGLFQVMDQWLVRTKQFGTTAKVTFLHALIVQGSKVGVGLFHPMASVLITLSALGTGIRIILLALFTKGTDIKSFFDINKNHEQVSLKAVAKTHRDFPLYRAPQTLIDAISQNLPILMLTSFFGPASAGFYTIGRTVLSVPVQLIGNSVGDVFYPRISEAGNNGENLTKLIKKATIALASVGIIPFGIVIIFGPWLFSFVFGEGWATAGEYARWIALWIFFMFINGPSIKAIPVLSLQAYQLKYSIITIIIRTTALAIGYFIFSSDLVAIALFGISGAVRTFTLTLIIIHKSKKLY